MARFIRDLLDAVLRGVNIDGVDVVLLHYFNPAALQDTARERAG